MLCRQNLDGTYTERTLEHLIKPRKLPVSRWFALQSLISDRPDRDLPPFPVMSVRLEWDEPAALDQNFGQFERALPILSDIGPVTINIARANGGFGPGVLEPVEQYSCLRGSWQRSRRGCRLLRWPRRGQSLKERYHCRHPLIFSLPSPRGAACYRCRWGCCRRDRSPPVRGGELIC